MFTESLIELVRAGLRDWTTGTSASVEILKFQPCGILDRFKKRRKPAPMLVQLTARMDQLASGMRRGTLHISSPFAGHVWVDESSTKLDRCATHWGLTCQRCNSVGNRRLLWPPGGPWGCRRCLKPRYGPLPVKRVLAGLGYDPNYDAAAEDRKIDALMRQLAAMKRRDGFE